jgi:aspartyl/glutamyl-tRNA(Asn/Gln) amidotransferase C subunit
MPALTREEVTEIALLARLGLDDQELATMQDELGAILEHFRALDAVATDGVEPMVYGGDAQLVMRVDAIEPSLTSAQALSGTAKHAGDLIIVPAILPGGTE